MFTKVVGQGLEEFEDDEKCQDVGDREAEGLFDLFPRHDFPELQKKAEEADSQGDEDEKDQELEEEIHHVVEEGQGIKILPSL